MIAWLPPLLKKSKTAKPSLLSFHRPPKMRSKSPNPLMVTGLFTGPFRARPMKAVMEVATPVIVRTPLGISSTYTPGYVSCAGINILSFCYSISKSLTKTIA
jgi:hypothetical protein